MSNTGNVYFTNAKVWYNGGSYQSTTRTISFGSASFKTASCLEFTTPDFDSTATVDAINVTINCYRNVAASNGYIYACISSDDGDFDNYNVVGGAVDDQYRLTAIRRCDITNASSSYKNYTFSFLTTLSEIRPNTRYYLYLWGYDSTSFYFTGSPVSEQKHYLSIDYTEQTITPPTVRLAGWFGDSLDKIYLADGGTFQGVYDETAGSYKLGVTNNYVYSVLTSLAQTYAPDRYDLIGICHEPVQAGIIPTSYYPIDQSTELCAINIPSNEIVNNYWDAYAVYEEKDPPSVEVWVYGDDTGNNNVRAAKFNAVYDEDAKSYTFGVTNKFIYDSVVSKISTDYSGEYAFLGISVAGSRVILGTVPDFYYPIDQSTELCAINILLSEAVSNRVRYYVVAEEITNSKLNNVYIHNGIEFKAYTPYIYNGSTWIEYTPYIYNGSTWIEY